MNKKSQLGEQIEYCNIIPTSTKIYVGKSQLHGYGVFATTDISKGTLIEKAPFIITNYKIKDKTVCRSIREHCVSIKCLSGDKKCKQQQFDFSSRIHYGGEDKYIMSSGCVQLYNNSATKEESNVEMKINLKTRCVEVSTTRDIDNSQELLYWYGKPTRGKVNLHTHEHYIIPIDNI